MDQDNGDIRYFGRREAYTEIGIRRKRCPRCGEVAVHQWQACANGRYYVPICLECDIAINEMVLRFLRIPDCERLIAEYRKKVLGE